MLGAHFEREIREQPGVWERIASSESAYALARALKQRDVIFLGSGSSLFMAQLGALALRRRGIRAYAVAASEAPFDNGVYRDAVVVGCSQSGNSSDILDALEILAPKELIAITNTADSALARRAQLTIDVLAGPEIAIPATKSISATAAILLWAAALVAQTHGRDAQALRETARDVRNWLAGPDVATLRGAAEAIARKRSVVVLGTGYGTPIADEYALKIKEASYVHAEGFSAGEFRHGSAAMLDESCAVIGIADDASRAGIGRTLQEAAKAGGLCFAAGLAIDSIAAIGPRTASPFSTLAWLVTGQMLALYAGRARGIDSDRPRGLSKTLRSP